MKLTDKIYVAGHNGLVGNSIYKFLQNAGYLNIITRSSKELDLRNKELVVEFFRIDNEFQLRNLKIFVCKEL